jgi:hypothetical protein
MRHRVLALTLIVLGSPAVTALAQPIGSFRWQLQPYCNVITVNVTQQGATYTLDGTDDRCGGANQRGSALGIAYLTPPGLIGFGITTVLPGGTPLHTEATINLATLGGTWRDSAGNSGAFVFTPGAGVPGAPRPVPSGGLAPGSVTNVQIAGNAVTGANVVDASLSSTDLADGPRIAFAGGMEAVLLPPTSGPPATLRSVTVTAPAAGRVIVNASGFFQFSSALQESARCEITTAAAIDNNFAFYGTESGDAATMLYIPFGSTRGFNVSAGPTTFNLLCDRVTGSAYVQRVHLTAIYAAQ